MYIEIKLVCFSIN